LLSVLVCNQFQSSLTSDHESRRAEMAQQRACRSMALLLLSAALVLVLSPVRVTGGSASPLFCPLAPQSLTPTLFLSTRVSCH
jgi:hypothetical protein